jgi:hypothetical protein
VQAFGICKPSRVILLKLRFLKGGPKPIAAFEIRELGLGNNYERKDLE